ncbi:hypothetical protein F6X40_35285 [Paraburkholderia sp. UCT31]|uniref:hypothetical protein n=1 Tax=Paraburkholderia sp. UCT31 TaxID=2615209 RepID=UPI0016556168|nr:hypothetical protein [Paraburkholderia sp. UCT31]MBC8741814.1 hypothetical protein [Paraburkholderia sp. UCT31]
MKSRVAIQCIEHQETRMAFSRHGMDRARKAFFRTPKRSKPNLEKDLLAASRSDSQTKEEREEEFREARAAAAQRAASKKPRSPTTTVALEATAGGATGAFAGAVLGALLGMVFVPSAGPRWTIALGILGALFGAPANAFFLHTLPEWLER